MTLNLLYQNTDTWYWKIKTTDFQHDIIESFLNYYGKLAFNEVRFYDFLLKGGVRVLDIGAFIGTFGLGVA